MKEKIIVAIHQPNFLPWLGYFNKIASSDIFVFLDDVQFPKNGGVWMNRNLVLDNGNKKWMTIPISRNFSGVKKINEIRISESATWRKIYLDKIKHYYSKAEYFKDCYKFLIDATAYDTELLSDLNVHLVKQILNSLDIRSGKIMKSSQLSKQGNSTELLCSLVKSVNGNSYLCGGGSASYIEPAVFLDSSIDLIYQDFRAIQYKQYGVPNFVAGLSIVDAMMNCGFKETKKLIENN